MGLFPHYAEAVARAATPGIAALSPRKRGPQAAGVPHEVLQYHHDPRNESFGEEAAEAPARDEGVDESALRWDRVLCSAGKRGWDVALHPRDLIALTNATTADIRA